MYLYAFRSRSLSYYSCCIVCESTISPVHIVIALMQCYRYSALYAVRLALLDVKGQMQPAQPAIGSDSMVQQVNKHQWPM